MAVDDPRAGNDDASPDEVLAGTLIRFLDESHFMEPDALAEAARLAGEAIGAHELTVHLADRQQRVLAPLVPAEAPTQPIDGSLAGRAFASGELLDTEEGDHHRVWAALIDGAERIGAIGFVVDDIDDPMRRRCLALASIITQFVVTKSQYTDVYDVATRQQEMTVAAEMQWRILPPLTCTTRRFGISAVLEPAYDLGGDAFDYAINGDTAHIAIVDAMGHGLDATWPATVVLGGIRQGRRRGLGLERTYVETSTLVRERFGDEQFATAAIAELDIEGGVLRWVNAGHPAPLHVRGGRVVGELPTTPSLPLGVGDEVAEVGEVALEPWDRVLFFTDGVTEGRAEGEDRFGVGRLAEALERETWSGTGPAETMRRLARVVLDDRRHRLEDDFTLLCVEWRHGEGRPAPKTTRVVQERTL